MIDVIILAGGLGTRLRSVLPNLPKPMAPVADRPFLAYLLDYLILQNVSNKFFLSVGYEYQKIIDYFGDNYQSCNLIYSVEHTPLGTGGGIKLALNQSETEQVLIVNGDTLFNVNLQEMRDFHIRQEADMTLALRPLENFERYNNVRLNENDRVVEFEEKKLKNKGLINGGIYILNKHLLERFTLPEKFSFEEDFLKPYINKIKVFGFVSNQYFIDIGIPVDYQKSQVELPALFNR